MAYSAVWGRTSVAHGVAAGELSGHYPEFPGHRCFRRTFGSAQLQKEWFWGPSSSFFLEAHSSAAGSDLGWVGATWGRDAGTSLLTLHLSEVGRADGAHRILGSASEVNREGEKRFLMFIVSRLTLNC